MGHVFTNGVCDCGYSPEDAAQDPNCPEAPDCLDDDGDAADCEGPVEYRTPLSGTGKSFPRCEKHWEERLETQQEIAERYPTSAPPDFDPAYAGEHWDEDY